jgi:hypothetical protein
LLDIIGAATSDIEFLQNRTTLQYAALDWLANEDAWEVDIDSVPSQVFVTRYALALLFFSTSGRSWINGCNFLTPTSVCEWTNGDRGVTCNEDELVVALLLGKKSKHEEVDLFLLFVCISRLLTFPCHSISTAYNQLSGSIPSEVGALSSLTKLSLSKRIGVSCWHECHACSHLLAVLFHQVIINSLGPFRANSKTLRR